MLEMLNNRVNTIIPEVISWRRHFHRQPELSGREEHTAAFIAEVLQKNGIRHQTGVGGHGIVAWLDNGSRDIPSIAFRADMDALPMQDAKTCDYASSAPGIMHACGHDGHTAVLLGMAVALAPIASQLPRPLILLFQPAEETGQGALAMLAEQVFASPPVALFGFHFFPHLETGSIAINQGTLMAATDHFSLQISGTSAHACYPEKAVDAIQIAAHLIAATNYLMAKGRDQIEPALISIGTIQGGTAANIIADQVTLTGTIRTLSLDQRQTVVEKFSTLMGTVAAAYGGTAALNISQVAPALTNNKDLCTFVTRLIPKVPEIKHCDLFPKPVLGGEDFAYFSQLVPSCYLKIGCGNEAKGIMSPLHSNLFDLDESSLELALKLLATIASQAQDISSSTK
ncbi:MAG: amidohydrolase [Deltaproteobacteria bacterium]|nr:amidohydrolase [Candidatus Anaeroferrophillus wilburensis]MBN2889326.1 amidohydrolase [Deltaproteobacteria bacterium]